MSRVDNLKIDVENLKTDLQQFVQRTKDKYHGRGDAAEDKDDESVTKEKQMLSLSKN